MFTKHLWVLAFLALGSMAKAQGTPAPVYQGSPVSAASVTVTGCPSGQFVKGDGTGCAAATGAPGGSNLQLQFNNSGTLGGAAGISTDAATKSLAYLASSIASGPPMLDIRHPTYGGVCDGTHNNPIDSALQAAVSSMSSAIGGQINLVGNPLYCYWSNPSAMTWAGHGTITINVQGNLHVGTTLQIPPNVIVHLVGINGTPGAQFAAPANLSAITVDPLSGNGTGTLGTALTPTYTGTGDPTASVPVVCNSSVAGNTYQDTNQTNADFWTCESTTGTITSPLNSLVIPNANGGGMVVGDVITIAGATCSGGCRVSAVALNSPGGSSTITLVTAASTTVAGAAVQVTQTPSGWIAPTNGWMAGAVLTFTPSSMSGLSSGAGISVGGALVCTLSTLSRTSNVVTAVAASSCHIPPGVVASIASVTDSTFNGTHVTGAAAGTFMVQSADWYTNTFIWKQGAAADGTSSGGTITGMNKDSKENILVSNCAGGTCTATFYRPHLSTDTWGLVGVMLNTNAQGTNFQNFTVTSPGDGLWLPQAYESQITNYSYTSTGGCGSNPATSVFSSGIDVGISTWIHFKGVSPNSFCEPWAIHMQQPANYRYANNGPIYIDDSLFIGSIYQDHGGMGVFMRNGVCDQSPGGCVTTDTLTPYWNGNVNYVRFENSWGQDNPNGWVNSWLYQTSPTGAGAAQAEITKVQGSTSTLVNGEYFTGQLKSDGGIYSNTKALGVVGMRNDGITMDGAVRPLQSGMGPSVVPFATENIDQTGASWSGACTVTTGVAAPDGSTTAVSLSGANVNSEVFGSKSGLTPAVGDMIVSWATVYSPTSGAQATVNGTGSAFSVDNNNSTHFQLGYLTSTFTNVGSNQYDSAIKNDWWHTVVSLAMVTGSDGTGSQTVRMAGGCDTTKTLTYFNPGMMYIAASSGIPLATVKFWMTQPHGAVPSNWNHPGVAVTKEPTYSTATAFSAVTITSHAGTLATSGGSLTNGTVVLDHTSTTTINVSGLANGSQFNMRLNQDSTGGATLTLGTGCTWLLGSGSGFVASTTPVLTAGASGINVLSAVYDGTNCLYNVQ